MRLFFAFTLVVPIGRPTQPWLPLRWMRTTRRSRLCLGLMRGSVKSPKVQHETLLRLHPRGSDRKANPTLAAIAMDENNEKIAPVPGADARVSEIAKGAA